MDKAKEFIKLIEKKREKRKEKSDIKYENVGKGESEGYSGARDRGSTSTRANFYSLIHSPMRLFPPRFQISPSHSIDTSRRRRFVNVRQGRACMSNPFLPIFYRQVVLPHFVMQRQMAKISAAFALICTCAGRGMSSLYDKRCRRPFLVPSLSSDRRRLFVISRPPG